MGARNFRTRVESHDELVEAILGDLRRWGYEAHKNGRETVPFSGALSIMTDPAAKEMRFKPDIVVLFDKRLIYLEAKDSRYIEKDPYIEYCNLCKRGSLVYIVFRDKNGSLHFCRADRLELQQGWHDIWPIDEDGWIAPRKHPRYQEYKFNYPKTGKPYPGAGTPFRAVDYSEMIDWGQMFFPLAVNNGW